MAEIRALDIGYGNVKVVAARTQTNMSCKLFPSLAPRATDTDLAGDFVRKRDTKRVVVAGQAYEIGPDAKLAQRGTEIGRLLREDYCLSDQYRALVYGGLLSMTRAKELDVLVLGLPVNTYRTYKDRLAAAFTGTFDLDGQGRSCVVKRCLVVPQPLGGFFDHAVSNKLLTAMSKGTTLVVDPGYCTLDWLVAEGTTPNDARSGARAHGGMGEVLKDVALQVAADAGCSVDELGSVERIDTALRENQAIKVFGQALKARSNAEYIKIAQRRAEDPLQEMLDKVGSTGDIDNILLVGGGAHVYAELLQARFPKHRIVTVPDSVFANVRGFQLMGEMWATRQQGRK
jgi:plasmid segregation protein ParM